MEEAKKGKDLLDQFQIIETQLADTQNQHEEYLKFTERQVQKQMTKNACFGYRELNKIHATF